jgi:hypothetical protein
MMPMRITARAMLSSSLVGKQKLTKPTKKHSNYEKKH